MTNVKPNNRPAAKPHGGQPQQPQRQSGGQTPNRSGSSQPQRRPGGQPQQPQRRFGSRLPLSASKQQPQQPQRRPASQPQQPQRRPASQPQAQPHQQRQSLVKPESLTAKPIIPPGKVMAPKLQIYALGGLEEIGRNCLVLECGADIVIIDAGLMFPEEGMPGIDYIIPNVSSLKGKEQNIRTIILTHGHMDHIGGLPLIIGKLGNPVIYTAPLTAGMVRKRQEEYGNAKSLKIQLVKHDTRVQLGRHFVFEPFHVNHNISDAFGAAIHTPYGTMLFTGDFKFDFTPVNDDPADLTHIAMFGAKGVIALFSDSTNAESPGHQISEKQVGAELERIFQNTQGRLIIGTFSSLLTRAQQIITLAEKYGRKVLIEGRSMQGNIELAHQMGYLHIKPGVVVEEAEFKRLPDNKAVVICTGAQGEKSAVLMRIANREHRHLSIRPGDSIVFSSSVIPGNERTVQRLKDTLVRQGATIFHYANLDVHAGGHAKQEDLKLMLRLTKPKYLIPVHGNRFLLEGHARLGVEVGIPRENIFVADNGQVIEFGPKGAQLTEERVMTDYVMVDGLGVGDVSEVVLRDRVALAEDGIFVIIATVDKRTGALVGSPDIISRGFVYMRENKELIDKARDRVKKTLRDVDTKSGAFDEHMRNKLRNDIGQFLFTATKRRPMVLPVIIEV